MRKQTTTLLRVLLIASLYSLVSSVAAQDSLSSFEQALEETGWSVQREADGSLILESRISSDNMQDEKKSTEDQWSRLQKELQATGWIVEREADGSLRLAQPPAKDTVSNQEEMEPTSKASASKQPQSMQQKLRNTGWKVTNSPDGSILLYPPDHSSFEKTKAKPKPCSGAKPVTNVMLPVDNWQEAHDIAAGWLGSQPPFNAAIGKIRKVLKVYVVSIVSKTAPYSLIQQLAIRNSDGAVIVLN